MESKTIASVSVFAAFTVALNLSPIKIPAPYAPFLIYEIWEIPIVAAFLLYGPSVGVAISIVNTIVLLGVFPGALPTGPLYNLAAVLSMLLGIYVVQKFATRSFRRRQEVILIASSTALGIVGRVGIMTVVNWTFLPFPPPLGFAMPLEALAMLLPVIGVFNATLALYTIPLGYFIAKAVSSGAKIAGWYS
ncbi:MAG: hypothetical protein ACE5OW_07245 [Candidatus Bathyarchaeia archaeon]